MKLLTLLVLNLGLHVVDGVRRLHLQGDGLARQRLDEDLHAAPQSQHQVEGGLLLDVVVGQRAAVLQLLASEDEALLVRGDTYAKGKVYTQMMEAFGTAWVLRDRTYSSICAVANFGDNRAAEEYVLQIILPPINVQPADLAPQTYDIARPVKTCKTCSLRV